MALSSEISCGGILASPFCSSDGMDSSLEFIAAEFGHFLLVHYTEVSHRLR